MACWIFNDYCDIMEFVLTKIAERFICCFRSDYDTILKRTIILNWRMAICLLIKFLFCCYYAFSSLDRDQNKCLDINNCP